NSPGDSGSPKNSRSARLGTPNRKDSGRVQEVSSRSLSRRENGSVRSNPLAVWRIRRASPQVSARIETQPSVRQAGSTPEKLSKPRVGLKPTMLLKAAGTRPEPAVSVPSAKLTMPVETATAEPELEPPAM